MSEVEDESSDLEEDIFGSEEASAATYGGPVAGGDAQAEKKADIADDITPESAAEELKKALEEDDVAGKKDGAEVVKESTE